MIIRNATLDDLEELYKIEQKYFPPAEAAKKEEINERLKTYPHHFWILENDEKIISFANGFVSDENDLQDKMYEDASLHNENGEWQMIFGLNTLPNLEETGMREF